MIGIVDVGGGMRGAYGAGILDYCMMHDIHFDYCIGVSAGSANCISYLAGQIHRNYEFYTKYIFRKDYMGIKNYLQTHSYLNLDYIYGTLSNSDGESPLDFDAIQRSDKILKVVCTDAETGYPVYFGNEDVHKDDYAIIKASSCVPVIDEPYPVYDRFYYDGGISDPIPFRKALEDGCDKVVIILTRPKDFYRDPKKDMALSRLIERKYPQAAVQLASRAVTYNISLDQAKKYEKKGNVLIVAPDDIGDMDTLTKDKEAIDKLYEKGYLDAIQLYDFLGISK